MYLRASLFMYDLILSVVPPCLFSRVGGTPVVLRVLAQKYNLSLSLSLSLSLFPFWVCGGTHAFFDTGYSVSFMTEFHEVECPDPIGRVAGSGRIASGQIFKFPPLMWGESPSGLQPLRCYSPQGIRLLLLNVVVSL